jgi:polysaccharide export outer membrane protein
LDWRFDVTRNTGHRLPHLISCAMLSAALLLSGCATFPDAPTMLPAGALASDDDSAYLIGPTDQLSIVVWRQAELSSQPIVRPDGKISVPLIDDMPAAGRTPTALGNAIAAALREYVQDPKVTVIVTNFVGPYDRQIRVLGEAAKPQAIAFRRNMTVLDVMIQVGGLTEFASGNRAVLTRASTSGPRQQFRLRLDDLLSNGDSDANAYVLPGDVIVIPQTYF